MNDESVVLDIRKYARQATAAGLPDASVLQGEAGVQLADFWAYRPTHSYIWTPSREMWAGASVNAVIGTVPGPDGKDIRATEWLDRNRAVEQITWAPGEPMIIEGRLISAGGWIDRPGVRVFNLYIPPRVELGDPDKAGPWLDHVQRIYPNDAAHIVAWLAHRVQRPGEKLNHALVLGGVQGIGKDTLIEPVKQAVGPWNVAEVSPTHMLGRFNPFVRSVILRVSEARDLGELDRYSFYEHCKSYIAAPPDVLRVDEKYTPEYVVPNVTGVLITTNHLTDGIYLPADDRRHYVAWSDATKEDFTPDYWSALYRWYAEGGVRHVAAYLATYDLSEFDPKAPPPKTPAFWDIVDANRAPEDAELSDVLERLGWPEATTLDEIAERAEPAFAEWLRDRRNSRRIPHRLEAVGYVRVRNDGTTDGRWKVGGRNVAIYAKADLSVRERMAAAQRLVEGAR